MIFAFLNSKGLTQCEIKSTYDKFTKVTTKTTLNPLEIKSSIYTAYFSLTLYSGGDLNFNVYIHKSFMDEEDILYFNSMTILFTDGTTLRIGDEFDQLHLNMGVTNHKAQIQILQKKKIEAIRVQKDGTNFDFDLPSNVQDYFIRNIQCLFQ